WEATAPDGRPVALKLVPWDGGGAEELRAAEALRHVRHPHLLPTLGVWHAAGFFVLALELADRTLLDRFHEARAQGSAGIPAAELGRYLAQASAAFDYLHARGVQHRDVKPQNLLLVRGTLKVADFGLARVLAHTVTGHTGRLTLAYAAPEFFEGQTARHSDQYG